MLEIILIIGLAQKVGAIVEEKDAAVSGTRC